MSTLPHPSTPLNPVGRRVADLLALFAGLCDLGSLDLAGRVLTCAWAAHARWPLDVDTAARGRALGALQDAERALVAVRNAAYYVEAGAVVAREGWAA